jgi:hypothetical protein
VSSTAPEGRMRARAQRGAHLGQHDRAVER